MFGARPHVLYRNRGDGTFEDVTRAAGIRSDRPDKEYGKGLGCLILDLTGDGKPDIYVCNDGVDNFLYLNRSEPGRMRFEEQGFALGVARDAGGMANGSMGVDAADFEGTGRPSIWVTNYENEFHALYRPGDKMFYNDSSARFGLNAIGTAFVGFGTVFADVDLDGWEDIVVNNGHVIRHSPKDNIRQRPVLFLNRPRDGGRYFVDAAKEGGPYFGQRYLGRGLAVVDLDNDGRPDLVFCNTNEPVRILRNESPADRHWLGVELVGRDRRDVVGARLTLDTGERKLLRFLAGGRSYLSSCDPRRLFGLGLGHDRRPPDGRMALGLAPDRALGRARRRSVPPAAAGNGEGGMSRLRRWLDRRSRRTRLAILVAAVVGLGGAGYQISQYVAAERHLGAARSAVERDDLAAAKDHLLACAGNRPNSGEVNFELARVCRRLEDFADARRYLKRAEELNWPPDAIAVEQTLYRGQFGELPRGRGANS